MKQIITGVCAFSLFLVPATSFADWKHKKPYKKGPPPHSQSWHSHKHNNGYNFPSSNNWNSYKQNSQNNWYSYKKPDYGDSWRNDWRNDGHFGSVGFQGDKAIWQGINSGRLSDAEARDLKRDAWEIKRKESAYRADGNLSYRERRDLEEEIRDYNKDLSHNLNDGERRWYFR